LGDLGAQRVVDAILNFIGKPEPEAKEDRRPAELVSGVTIQLPAWFLEENGHKWLTRVRKAIPELNKLGNEDAAMAAMASNVADRFPNCYRKMFLMHSAASGTS
jgi:hypothetical protein